MSTRLELDPFPRFDVPDLLVSTSVLHDGDGQKSNCKGERAEEA